MQLIKEKSFYKNLFALAIPIVLQNLVTYSVTLADNLMIGSLGDVAVSGVYMGGQIQTILQVAGAGIEAAVLLLSAQYWGRRDTGSIRKIVKLGMSFSLLLGAIVTTVCAITPRGVIGFFADSGAVVESGAEYLSIVCWSYLFFCTTQALIASMRAVESARIGLYVSLVSLVVDVGLNYVLIFGKFGFPEMGIAGAALATLIARICETAVIASYVLFIDKKLRLVRRESLTLRALLSFDGVLLRDFVRYGAPLMAGQIVWGVNLTANSIILGRFPESVITAASLANTINSLIFVMSNGLSAAIGILTGKKVGAGKIDDIKAYANTVQLIFLGLGLFSSALLLTIRVPFISLYSITEEARMYSMQFIGVLCVTIIGTCYQAPSLFGLVKSGGDESFVFRNDTIFVFCVVIPSAAITAALGCPAWVVFLCLKIDQLLKCIVAFFKIRRYNWMKNLTR
ncbi:MAG: MATE family efflux transporter [Clostridia bacterium]|nr:MATE family efflux transporter [Clostridia bacterium]